MPEAPTVVRRLGPVLVAGAGFLGAAGVVLSAVAAHAVVGPSLSTAGTFCLVHAAAVLAIGASALRSRLLPAAGVLLLVGAAFFTIGVAVHALGGISLGPLAPTGGVLSIGGWLLVAAGGLEALFARAVAERP